MPNDDIALIKKKSLSGVIALTSRTFLLQIIAFVSTFLLTIFLSPEIFGVFYVVSAVIAFLAYFSDIGLAAALIQKKEELSQDDLKTTFTIQQILVVIVVIIALILSYYISLFYKFDNEGLLLFRSLVIAFFLSSLKTIPSVLLERKLEFNKLILPQILETVSFYTIAVVLAWQGNGITSFTWAVLVRSIVGLVAIYIVSPWSVRIGFSKESAKKLLRFGLPFQANSILALIKDDLLIVYLGKILPFAEVGYIGWAKKWAEVPLRLIMDSVVRVTFPMFSRLQHESIIMGKAIDKTIFALAMTIFPITVAMIFFIEPLVHIIPRYVKWEPAMTSFYLFAIASAIASLSTPMTNALNAVGKIKITLKLMIGWTISTWVLTVLLVHFIGFNGVALSLLIITSSIVLVVKLVKQVTTVEFISAVRGPVIASLVQAVWYWAISTTNVKTVPLLTVWVIVGVILYLGCLIVIDRHRLDDIYHLFKKIWSP